MEKHERKVAIIGGGIAGLCTAVYAAKCGYKPEVFEMHECLGGLATSWRRGDYTFETCLHWLLGSRPGSPIYDKWKEVFDIDRLTFVHHEEFARIEDATGDVLRIYSDIGLLEAELLSRAPKDASAIHHFTETIRRLVSFELPDSSEGWMKYLRTLLQDALIFPMLFELSKISSKEYGHRFTDPLLRSFFGDGESGRLSAVALLFSLAWMSNHDADYPIGGSQAVIREIARALEQLGGKVHCGSKVQEILVRDGVAVGVRLENGTPVMTDWTVSAADGHATIFDLLHGQFVGDEIAAIYQNFDLFPSYVQVSLGVGQDLSSQPAFLIQRLKRTIQVDPATALAQVSFRFFHFDPTFAPKGKTAVTCFLPTSNAAYWVNLARDNSAAYMEEKMRLRDEITQLLEERIPGLSTSIETIDVSTPATVIRLTGNWQGSMQGWLLTPGMGFNQLPRSLPNLDSFLMAGQWIEPGGGLPSGLFTARAAVREMCKKDGIHFLAPH